MTVEMMPLAYSLTMVEDWHAYGVCDTVGEHAPSCTLAAEVERLTGEDQSATIATLNADVDGLAGELTRYQALALAAQAYRTAAEAGEPTADAWTLTLDALDALGVQ